MLLFSENYGIMKKMREIRRNLSMAFCTNCGAKLADDAKFCTECGAKLMTGDKFCRECGAPVFR